MPSSPKLRGRRTHEKRLSTNPIFRVLVVVVVVVLVLMFRGKTRSGSPRGVATQNDASPAYLDMVSPISRHSPPPFPLSVLLCQTPTCGREELFTLLLFFSSALQVSFSPRLFNMHCCAHSKGWPTVLLH